MTSAPESADRRRVIHEAFHLERDPARDVDGIFAAKRNFRKVVERHDAGHDRNRHAALAHFVDKVEVGIGIEEELRDR